MGKIIIGFFRRYKIVSILGVLCIYYMIKVSGIPYFIEPGNIIEFLFDRPEKEFWIEVSAIIEVFASAYITSLFFYIVVEYIPIVKKENKAKIVCAPQLKSLYFYLSNLIATIKFSADRAHIEYKKDVNALDKLEFDDNEVLCDIKTLVGGKEKGVATYSYSLLKESCVWKNAIIEICKTIASTPSFSYCDIQLVNIISQIQLCELWRILGLNEGKFAKLNASVEKQGLGCAFFELENLKEDLAIYVNEKIDVEFIEISVEKVKEWEQTQKKIFDEYPELVDIIRTLS